MQHSCLIFYLESTLLLLLAALLANTIYMHRAEIFHVLMKLMIIFQGRNF